MSIQNIRRVAKVVWAWIKENEIQLKIVFTVLAGAYVLFEYSLKSHGDKIEKTLKYVERYNQFEVATARKKLDAFWLSKSVAEWKLILNPENYSSVVPELIKKQDLIGEVQVLGSFYRELALCVNRNICSGETACQFFFAHLQGFRHDYKWYLDELENGWKEPAAQTLDKMISTSCKKDLRGYCSAHPASPYCKPSNT